MTTKQFLELKIGGKRTIEKLVKDGKYDWSNSNINDENFPLKSEKVQTLDVALFHFDEEIESAEAIARMEKEGYVPATVEHLLSLGIQYPDLQREFLIVALGSVVQLYGIRRVAYLDGSGSRRGLDLDWLDGRWRRQCRFLAFRKHGPQNSEPSLSLVGSLVTLTLGNGEVWEGKLTKKS
jgi:hypothetical protein